ncbi:hypothetical protein BJ742DRAFT_395513 [Cladochytrium replicatum]|nr:hypothetical protein BJ742DRAFT_395513 [Cladochytrium replicatum]
MSGRYFFGFWNNRSTPERVLRPSSLYYCFPQPFLYSKGASSLQLSAHRSGQSTDRTLPIPPLPPQARSPVISVCLSFLRQQPLFLLPQSHRPFCHCPLLRSQRARSHLSQVQHFLPSQPLRAQISSQHLHVGQTASQQTPKSASATASAPPASSPFSPSPPSVSPRPLRVYHPHNLVSRNIVLLVGFVAHGGGYGCGSVVRLVFAKSGACERGDEDAVSGFGSRMDRLTFLYPKKCRGEHS